jgi:oxalate decarboxylase/phosphoglucose isomerase-like protein (cupin superfamily)
MKYNYPHRIANGGGEELTFVNLIENDSGGMLEVENRVQPGAGPPMHIHHLQDESLTIVRGLMAAKTPGKAPTLHGPGETVTFTRGVPHRFWNAGTDELVCKGWVTPAHNVEYFLTEIFASTRANGGKRPSIFDGAFLQMKYRSEFDMIEIPGLVKKIIFPLVVATGKLLGKHKKFANGPNPAHR